MLSPAAIAILLVFFAVGCQSFEIKQAERSAPDSGTVEDGGVFPGSPGYDNNIFVTTVAGNGKRGAVDGTGGPTGTAEFRSPCGVAVDLLGNVYVADTGNSRIRKIDPDGNVTTLAGNGVQGFADGTGGPHGTAEFFDPRGLAADNLGNVFVADTSNNRIRKIDPEGNVTTVAGTGSSNSANGPGGPNGVAEFELPYDVAVDAVGNLFVAEPWAQHIRMIDTADNVTTLAGDIWGYEDGTAGEHGQAEFRLPAGVAVDVQGNVLVADWGNNRIREISAAGYVTTLAGNGAGTLDGAGGYANGSGGPTGMAEFKSPQGVAVDTQGFIAVADTLNSCIRTINTDGNVGTIAGNVTGGFMDGPGGPDGPAQFNGPTGVAFDVQGDIYVADTWNNRIRKITW